MLNLVTSLHLMCTPFCVLKVEMLLAADEFPCKTGRTNSYIDSDHIGNRVGTFSCASE